VREKIDEIISTAISKNSSDIHIEPREEFVKIRYRIDGILFDQDTIPKKFQSALISSIKIMVNLDIAESRMPQDGKHKIKSGKKAYDLRVSTLPTIYGEKIVVRILERDKIQLTLSDIGFRDELLSSYRQMISKRNGMILITGPTGSGKTTTLYATLKELNHKENNIVTIEDPVEYQLPGISQTQVNYKIGLTFPKILRSVLRQDPDIILVGEIRDLETAKIAVQAALTGHLILGTLHTRDAKGAFSRLVELGIDEYLVKDVLLGVIAQRLVRVIPFGRMPVFEIMEGYSPNKGMRTLKDEALRLFAEGLTTKEEIAKIIDIN